MGPRLPIKRHQSGRTLDTDSKDYSYAHLDVLGGSSGGSGLCRVGVCGLGTGRAGRAGAGGDAAGGSTGGAASGAASAPGLSTHAVCALEARAGEGVSLLDAAMRRLFAVPAPDLEALGVKVALVVDHEVATLTGGEACLAVLKADAGRLLGAA